jgi:hypothetical protein
MQKLQCSTDKDPTQYNSRLPPPLLQMETVRQLQTERQAKKEKLKTGIIIRSKKLVKCERALSSDCTRSGLLYIHSTYGIQLKLIL